MGSALPDVKGVCSQHLRSGCAQCGHSLYCKLQEENSPKGDGFSWSLTDANMGATPAASTLLARC